MRFAILLGAMLIADAIRSTSMSSYPESLQKFILVVCLVFIGCDIVELFSSKK